MAPAAQAGRMPSVSTVKSPHSSIFNLARQVLVHAHA
jgi:hypothetical protein